MEKVVLDKDKLLSWMREIQAVYHELWHREDVPEIFNADAARMWGLILAMGLEIKSGRFDIVVDENAIKAVDRENT
jgi:hypothetical protein